MACRDFSFSLYMPQRALRSQSKAPSTSKTSTAIDHRMCHQRAMVGLLHAQSTFAEVLVESQMKVSVKDP